MSVIHAQADIEADGLSGKSTGNQELPRHDDNTVAPVE
jgi:hypothetical protein